MRVESFMPTILFNSGFIVVNLVELIMNLFDLNFGTFLFFFPGLLFIIVVLPVWLFGSNYIMKKVDKTQISFFDNFKGTLHYLRSLRNDFKLSDNFFYNLTSILLLVGVNYFIVSSLFNSLNFDILIILTLFLVSLLIKLIKISKLITN